MKDYYQILGISQVATNDEIKKAYYKQVKKFHPDANEGSNDFREKLAEIQEAYEVLSNPTARSQYDKTLPETAKKNEIEINIEEEWDWENDPLLEEIRNKKNNPLDRLYYNTIKFLRNKLR